LARALKKRGDDVFGCDSFNAYYDPQLKRDREQILKAEGIDVVEADICQPGMLDMASSATHFVHLAAQAGVRYSMVNPGSYIQSNVDGFRQVLEMLRRFPHIPLTYASSSSVYGSNTKIPFAESDPTDFPCNLYGATKKANEVMAYAYHHMYGLKATGLRFFSVYGPWGRPDMAYFSFSDAIIEGKTLKIHNHGQMKRDFTYIDDVVSGIISAIDLALPNEIFNLGNNHPENLLDLVQLLEENLGKKAVLDMLPHQMGEVPITYADISKSQKILNFSPKVSLSEGLSRFTSWYLDYKKAVRL
jgi:UDP-glucuronate 4-epimerase